MSNIQLKVRDIQRNKKVWPILKRKKKQWIETISVSPYIGFSKQKYQNSYYKYVQRRKENHVEGIKGK